MMFIENRTILSPKTTAILCPANGCGIMSHGILSEIAEIAGPELYPEVKTIALINGSPRDPGDHFMTSAYKMSRRGVKHLFHAVLIKYPGGIAGLQGVSESLRGALQDAVSNGVKSIAIPCMAFETSLGLDKKSVARISVTVAKEFESSLVIWFIDTDKEYINEIENILNRG